jgi:mRNA-degrading endonuclease toxin of MazEF toxin-antitoxin module
VMQTICLARLDKSRPVVVLTRDVALSVLTNVTVAPITTTVRGLSVEVAVGERNGLDGPSVITCDNVQCHFGGVRPGLTHRLRHVGSSSQSSTLIVTDGQARSNWSPRP